MSQSLVGWALTAAAGSGLSPRARLVLVTMCDAARDTDTPNHPARVYFGGWQRLADVLDPDERMTPGSRHVVVGRAVAELVHNGRVKVVDNQDQGWRRWYRITP